MEKPLIHDDYYYYDMVSKNVRKYRKLANLTQEQLAELVEVTTDYISKIETGNPRKFYTLAIIGRIADALKIDIRQLFDDGN